MAPRFPLRYPKAMAPIGPRNHPGWGAPRSLLVRGDPRSGEDWRAGAAQHTNRNAKPRLTGPRTHAHGETAGRGSSLCSNGAAILTTERSARAHARISSGAPRTRSPHGRGASHKECTTVVDRPMTRSVETGAPVRPMAMGSVLATVLGERSRRCGRASEARAATWGDPLEGARGRREPRPPAAFS
jgi:hypothetical protein